MGTYVWRLFGEGFEGGRFFRVGGIRVEVEAAGGYSLGCVLSRVLWG